MKFNCGLTDEEIKEKLSPTLCNWHKWFAWFPVRVGHMDCRWLEYVERKGYGVMPNFFGIYAPYDCQYRAIERKEECS